jgi:Acetoacetate decarboxylase (ADC)
MWRAREDFGSLSRREMIRRSALGFGLAALRPAPSWADAPRTVTRLLVRYRTDPKRIQRVLPPPLQPDEKAEVWVEYALANLPGAPAPSLVEPASYGWSGIFVTARHQDKPGLFPVGLWTSDEWTRINAREFLGLNVKHAEVSLAVEGKAVRASVRRGDDVLHRVESTLQETAAQSSPPPDPGRREVFSYFYRLNPNWSEGVLTGAPIRLARLGGDAPPAANAASEAAGSGLLGCSIEQTVFQWDHASPQDPAIEFPVEEILAAGFEKDAALDSLLVDPRSQGPPREQAQVAARDFEPWAMLNYDRPVTNAAAWQPKGWRESATAYRLSDEELETYRTRKEMHLGAVNVVDIQLVTEREVFIEALPPQFQPGLRLRILALRVGDNDLTTEPFNETWLFAYGLLENRPLWFALSHIVGPGGGLTFGRETFGYPSKRGEVDVVTTPIDFSASGRRKGRDFFYTEGTFQAFSTGTSLSQIDIACLRSGPFSGGDSRGEFIAQEWFFQGQRSFVDRASLVVELPDKAADLGRPDPWFEFNPFRVVSVTVMQQGGMQRMPAEIVTAAGGIAPFYRERCDGVLPGEDPATDAAPPTFRIKPGVTTRSALRSYRS